MTSLKKSEKVNYYKNIALFTKPIDLGGLGWSVEQFRNATIWETMAVLQSCAKQQKDDQYQQWRSSNFSEDFERRERAH